MQSGFFLLRAMQLAIHIKGNLRLIAVYDDGRFILIALFVSLPTKMNEGLGAPCDFVQIEGVLAELSIHADEPLLVDAVLAAFIAAVCGKVEHIPRMGRPQPRTGLNYVQQVLMVNALVGFGVIAAFGRRALIGGIRIGAVFRKTDGAMQIFPVILVKEVIVLFKLTQMPTEVQIVTADIGDLRQGLSVSCMKTCTMVICRSESIG